MKRNIIYLDNAATTHPKPESVYRAVDAILRAGGSPGRSAHELALAASRNLFENRVKIAGFLGAPNPERLIFTPGCTQSLNMVVRGMGLKSGDLVVVSGLEHNAVMRPLHYLQERVGIEICSLKYRPGQIVDLSEFEELVKKRRPALTAMLEASNVSGEIQDLVAISDLCRQYEIPLLVDAAQSAGAFQAKLDKLKPSFWAASGHKGLYGPAGVGLLYVGSDFELEPLVFGGTGSNSEKAAMPDSYPDRLEAGTMNGPAIAGLAAGIDFLEREGVEKIREKELSLSTRFIDWLKEHGDIFSLVGEKSTRRTASVSFQLSGMDAGRVAELLDRDYGICLRSGLHCAAAAHRSLGTIEKGLLRASFGFFNSDEDLQTLCESLLEISALAIKRP